MGRKPKPTHLKIVGGEKRPSRIKKGEPPSNPGTAPATAWLSGRAAEIYDQITGTLTGMGIASADDMHALALCASRLEEVEILTVVVEDVGRTYASEGGLWKARPEVAMRNEAMRHAQSLLAEFGLTPSARSKVSAGKKPEANPFAGLKQGYAATAEAYARDVVAGRIPANKFIRLACQRHLDDLEWQTDKNFKFVFDPKKGAKVAKFAEMMPHTKGKWAAKGEKLKLKP